MFSAGSVVLCDFIILILSDCFLLVVSVINMYCYETANILLMNV
jgi:hypothetical protein